MQTENEKDLKRACFDQYKVKNMKKTCKEEEEAEEGNERHVNEMW